MLDAFEKATGDWPAGTTSIEHFVPPTLPAAEGAKPYRVRRSTTGAEMEVEPGGSMLAALWELGAKVDASCEGGICGACEVRWLEGEPIHRDRALAGTAPDPPDGLRRPVRRNGWSWRPNPFTPASASGSAQQRLAPFLRCVGHGQGGIAEAEAGRAFAGRGTWISALCCRGGWLPVAQRIDEQGEGRRGLPAARVVEVVARKGRAPVGQHPDEPPLGKMRLHLVLRQVRQAEPGQAPRSVSGRWC